MQRPWPVSVQPPLDRISHGNQRAVEVVYAAVVALSPVELPLIGISQPRVVEEDVEIVVNVCPAERDSVEGERESGGRRCGKPGFSAGIHGGQAYPIRNILTIPA